MRQPSHADVYEMLCLQAADEGRGPVLFGSSFDHARTAARPFMVGERFPNVYLEFPLIGDPFLDVTVLLGKLEAGTHIASEAAAGTEAMLDWYADACHSYPGITCGYELDTKEATLPPAAVHFQPRARIELVEPFCAAVGEPERAALYHGLAERLPSDWQPSFFGLFRGRPQSPLRVCGYLSRKTVAAGAADPSYLACVFDRIGFTAYDEAMLAQASQLMAVAPGTLDYQLDVYPDGSLGSTFAFDVQFGIEQPKALHKSFATGEGARVMGLLEAWGVADERWKLGVEAAFARALPVERDDGSVGPYAFTLMPQWVKTRWCEGVLQAAKLYSMSTARFV